MRIHACEMAAQSCFVYKSLRKLGTYVYLARADDMAALPHDLRESLGRLDFVMQFDLTPERRLARADARGVIGALKQRGFYLQLPPMPLVESDEA